MQTIGMVGLGKLGLPVSIAMASRGAKVIGYDKDPYKGSGGHFDELAKHEAGMGTILPDFHRAANLDIVTGNAGIIFVAVETPHAPAYEGVTPLPKERIDFDYSALKRCLAMIQASCFRQSKSPVIVIVSTVLPGTFDRELKQQLIGAKVIYSPSFIAMGTTIADFLNPEMILCGILDQSDGSEQIFTDTMRGLGIPAPILGMSIVSAETTKVAYNTFIGLKIAFANTVMEVCHHFPEADCDDVMNALKQAHKRLISPMYLSPGMGDGGGCHPRDNIALSHLARNLRLSYDLFEKVMECREQQAAWLCALVAKEALESDLPITIYGTAFKADCKIQTGSSAVLCAEILRSWGHKVTEYDQEIAHMSKGVYLIGCNHSWMSEIQFEKGSVIIDPWGITTCFKDSGAKHIYPGRAGYKL